ncbi:MAG: response regulator [Acidimicrobiales bacterium]
MTNHHDFDPEAVNVADSDVTYRVLVVDDEFAQRKLLRAYLDKGGFDVVEAESYSEAIDQFERSSPDIAVVDVMLPGSDGFDLVKSLRTRTNIPIIMLTARGEEAAKIAGLEIGADDYVVKPYSAPEVISRIKAHLRRASGSGTPVQHVDIGKVHLDAASRRCFVGDEEIDLSRREFDLLWVLATNPGKVFTRENLLIAGWGTSYVIEKTVDVHIATLRKKLGDALNIKSLRGIGYRLDV